MLWGTLLLAGVDRACLRFHVHLCKAKNREDYVVLLFHCWRPQSMLRKSFLQCCVLMNILEGIWLLRLTINQRANMWDKKFCGSQDWCCKIKEKRNLLSPDLHVCGGSRSWSTKPMSSAFPFLSYSGISLSEVLIEVYYSKSHTRTNWILATHLPEMNCLFLFWVLYNYLIII